MTCTNLFNYFYDFCLDSTDSALSSTSLSDQYNTRETSSSEGSNKGKKRNEECDKNGKDKCREGRYSSDQFERNTKLEDRSSSREKSSDKCNRCKNKGRCKDEKTRIISSYTCLTGRERERENSPRLDVLYERKNLIDKWNGEKDIEDKQKRSCSQKSSSRDSYSRRKKYGNVESKVRNTSGKYNPEVKKNLRNNKDRPNERLSKWNRIEKKKDNCDGASDGRDRLGSRDSTNSKRSNGREPDKCKKMERRNSTTPTRKRTQHSERCRKRSGSSTCSKSKRFDSQQLHRRKNNKNSRHNSTSLKRSDGYKRKGSRDSNNNNRKPIQASDRKNPDRYDIENKQRSIRPKSEKTCNCPNKDNQYEDKDKCHTGAKDYIKGDGKQAPDCDIEVNNRRKSDGSVCDNLETYLCRMIKQKIQEIQNLRHYGTLSTRRCQSADRLDYDERKSKQCGVPRRSMSTSSFECSRQLPQMTRSIENKTREKCNDGCWKENTEKPSRRIQKEKTDRCHKENNKRHTRDQDKEDICLGHVSSDSDKIEVYKGNEETNEDIFMGSVSSDIVKVDVNCPIHGKRAVQSKHARPSCQRDSSPDCWVKRNCSSPEADCTSREVESPLDGRRKSPGNVQRTRERTSGPRSDGTRKGRYSRGSVDCNATRKHQHVRFPADHSPSKPLTAGSDRRSPSRHVTDKPHKRPARSKNTYKGLTFNEKSRSRGTRSKCNFTKSKIEFDEAFHTLSNNQ